MISLFFIYIDFIISRYRPFYIIVNLLFLFHYRDDSCIIHIFFFYIIISYITFNIIISYIIFYITFSFFIIITFIILKN